MKIKILFLLIFANAVFASNIIEVKKELKQGFYNIVFSLDSNSTIREINTKINNRALKTNLISAPNRNLSNAAIFLIDTSLPMKQAYEKGIQQTIKNIYKIKKTWYKWAIASFDSGLQMKSGYGDYNLSKTLREINIRGQRTELVRSSLLAIENLKKINEPKKYLMIFSDGDFEDNAYKLEEVIQKAKDNNIEVLAFGYRDSIKLQSIRRLAEDTNGKLWIANKSTHQLPSNYINEISYILNNVYQLSVSMKDLKPNALGYQNLEVNINLNNGKNITDVIKLPVKKIKTKIKKSSNIWIIIIVFIVFLAIILYLILKKNKNKNEDTKQQDELEVLAYFETKSGTKHMIVKQYTTIGALADNDIVLDGEYISRYHASLQLKEDKFYIADLNSKNGLFVNGEKIKNKQIADGDTISFSQYEVIFRLLEE